MRVFRSRRSVGIENGAKRVSEVEKEWAHALISIKNDFHKISRNSEKLSNTKLPFIDLGLLKLLDPLLLFLSVFVNSMFPPFQ